ncbi:hypothetical protein EAG18_09005 [Pseudoalteromonas sp. J010]|nr:hypothetical protein EAG18_09005 [Pseudoalteromonas sp. J010]
MWSNYWRMFQKRGPRLPYNYFIENHMFDLLNGTNTHMWLPKEEYKDKLKNLGEGVQYESSWTSIIKESTKRVFTLSSHSPSDFDYIDAGCGKGKVLLVWRKLLKNYTPHILGIEYSEELHKICLDNINNTSGAEVNVLLEDVTNVTLNTKASNLCLYLYNPFSEKILSNFLDSVVHSYSDIYIIYNNPENAHCLFSKGFEMIYQKKGWHANSTYSIFHIKK